MQNTIIPPYFSKPTIEEEQNEESQKLLHYHNNETDDPYHQVDILSLRDLPITAIDSSSPHLQHNTTTAATINHSRHSSTSDPTSDFFFEFLINNDDDLITSTGDDVIFHGRLLPYTPPPRPRRSLSLSSAAARLTRPHQLNESSSSSLSPPKALPSIRPSRSLNYRKLRRNRSNTKPKNETMNRTSCNGNTRFNSDKSPAKLPWYWALVFGLPKIPAEMELKDIKNRQFRRNSTPPPPPSSSFFSGDRSCSSASWKLLNVLSCKSHVTVDVSNTAPFRNSLF
ncbi:uncharacterized protein LOC110691059 [Chenopodium quinoa]|uniref:uncharacterized protein LOC110691059 n=1 Tax=Chenopodium quinoa TaxID=63459 RepID=UPI000B780F88|nr:uncharacterized protein LOC110691059 [Chenopodium quinoa]